jgi:hypothetical protein
MSHLVYEASINYVTEDGLRRSVVYTLLCRWGAAERVYDIACAKLGEGLSACDNCRERYDGVCDNEGVALEIVHKLVDKLVMPEHLICVVDELIGNA